MVITQVTNTGVQVDVCSEHGTWFDRHELEDLAKAVGAGVALGSEDVPVAERAKDGTQPLRWVLKEMRGLFARKT
jgi:Zn-finger nucleic acid-binding protein